MGGWAVAQSTIFGTTITLSKLRSLGYSSMLDHYLKHNLKFNEPPSTAYPALDAGRHMCLVPMLKLQSKHVRPAYGETGTQWRSFDQQPSTRLGTVIL